LNYTRMAENYQPKTENISAAKHYQAGHRAVQLGAHFARIF